MRLCLVGMTLADWPQGFPRRWLTGQVWKRHFAEESVQGILHRQDEAMRQDETGQCRFTTQKGYKRHPFKSFCKSNLKDFESDQSNNQKLRRCPSLGSTWSMESMESMESMVLHFYTMLNLGIFMWNQWTSLGCISCSVHVPERSSFRLSDALDDTRCDAKFTALLNSNIFQWRSAKQISIRNIWLHISISLALATGDSIASGASRLRTLKMMGKPWPSPRSE